MALPTFEAHPSQNEEDGSSPSPIPADATNSNVRSGITGDLFSPAPRPHVGMTARRDQGPKTANRKRATSTPFLTKVDVPRAADVLADRLRQAILSGQLRPGQSLPTERQLMVQTGLGRSSVREALRTLEIEDLIESRLGRYGGWFIRRPDEDSVARSIDVFIRGRQLRFEALLETREAIEPASAALAARNRTDHDLAELDRRNAWLRAVVDDVPAYLLGNVEWHLAVVRATHNELLIAVMSALSDAIHGGTDLEDFNSDDVRAAALHAHDRVVDAIRQHDEDAAFRRMYRHLHAFRLQASGQPHPHDLKLNPRAQARPSAPSIRAPKKPS
jgi:DNA-binding FadR family transcriptional regulator